MEKYLEKLINKLWHLPNSPNIKFYKDRFIHNKIINKCQNIFIYLYSYFKFTDSFANLIHKLHFSIIIYI